MFAVDSTFYWKQCTLHWKASQRSQWSQSQVNAVYRHSCPESKTQFTKMFKILVNRFLRSLIVFVIAIFQGAIKPEMHKESVDRPLEQVNKYSFCFRTGVESVQAVMTWLVTTAQSTGPAPHGKRQLSGSMRGSRNLH